MNNNGQSKKEEIANAISHGIMVIGSIIGFITLLFLAVANETKWSLFSAFCYGLSMVSLFTFSTLYHSLTHQTAKRVFNILDHCGIFLLIAGTYTPVLLMTIGGETGWVFFGFQWTMAIIGILLKTFLTGRFNTISTVLYAVMGWVIIFKINLLKSLLPAHGFYLLVSGGIAYTLGIIFFIIDTRMKFSHFIWHLFVIAGALLHFIMMVMYVF